MTTAALNGPNRLPFSTNGDGHETKHKEDAKEAKTGRDGRGRFAAGNPGGPGNPHARRVAHFRKLVLETVTDQDLKEIVVTLILKAKEGDVAAARLLLAYTLGKPAEAVDPDRLDIEEWQLAQEGGVRPAQMQELMATLPADKANELLDIVRPCVLEQQLIDPMLSGLAKLDRQDAAREARRAKKAEQKEPQAAKQPDGGPETVVTDNKRGKRGPESEESARDLETTVPTAGEVTADSKRGKPTEFAGIEESPGKAATESKRCQRRPASDATVADSAADNRKPGQDRDPAPVESPSPIGANGEVVGGQEKNSCHRQQTPKTGSDDLG